MPIVILEIAVPALIGIVSGAVVGFRQVRTLRELTGDDSVVTNVLSGEVFRHHMHEEKEAA